MTLTCAGCGRACPEPGIVRITRDATTERVLRYCPECTLPVPNRNPHGREGP